LVVIDGVRRTSDIDLVQDNPDFTLVYVEAAVRTRYERLQNRHQNEDDSTLTYEEFLEDHGNETERFIPELKPTASHVIENEGTLAELHHQVDVLMATLGRNKTNV
jgi:dephospho-CoA kinase